MVFHISLVGTKEDQNEHISLSIPHLGSRFGVYHFYFCVLTFVSSSIFYLNNSNL